MIELIVFIVIVGTALAGIISVLNVAVKGSADPVQPKQALMVAESMLEEVLLHDFANPTGGYAANCPGTCDRTQFDDVGDYHNYAGDIFDAKGDAVSALAGYTVKVTVAAGTAIPAAAATHVSGPAPVPRDVTAADIKQVVVDVKTPAGQTYSITGYRLKND